MEDKEVRELCSKCFREHDNKCVALNECCLSYSKTLEDLKTEYDLYDKAIRTDNPLGYWRVNNGKYEFVEDREPLGFKTECKHTKGTTTNTDYDMLNGFTVIRVYCVECRKLLLTQIEGVKE